MPLDFPASPTNGQYYNGYVYNSANEVWDSAYAPRAATIPISSPNYIINGAFDINQRGFTSGTGAGSYNFDRWRTDFIGGTVTTSAQSFTIGELENTSIPAQNFLRVVTTGQSAVSDYTLITQPIENVKTLANRTVTVSFWAKAASGTPKVSVELQQVFNGSSAVNADAGQITLSTAWSRYSLTVTIPSVSGKTIGANSSIGLRFWVSAGSNFNARTGSIGIQSNTFDFWGVQLEAGAAATEFRRNAPSIQAELAACQRYYYQWTASTTYNTIGNAMATTTTGAYGTIDLPVRMRVRASSVVASGTFNFVQASNGNYSGSTALAMYDSTPDSLTLQLTGMSAVFTSGNAGWFRSAATGTEYFSISAEL